MKVNIYSIYDSAVQAFMQPFFSATDQSAQRAIIDNMSDPRAQSMLAKHYQDFSLFHIGTFNDHDGVIEAFVPVMVCTLLSLNILKDKEPTNDNT